ncbi:MAG: UDP-glucose dehydrogenase family protein [Holosporales bacterium]
MRITVVGTGYVGLVSGTCFAEFGYKVTCVDKDSQKIDLLNAGGIPIFEPGLEDLVRKNVKAGRMSFTTDMASAVAESEIVFIAVGTPSRRGDGHADLSYVYAAAEEIAQSIQGYTVVVNKSTVPVGTGRKVAEIIAKYHGNEKFSVASNPEFLREGSAIEDFMRPNRVVIGVEDTRAAEVMQQLYRPISTGGVPLVVTSRESAEVIKYAANAFLATKVAFINEMADLCEQVGADVKEVSRGMGLDHRIGAAFLNAGPGYGGSCFPKDTRALVQTAREHAVSLSIVESVVTSNDQRKHRMAARILDLLGDPKGKKIALLGATFKPDTDDMRESPSLDIVPQLVAAGVQVTVCDPQAYKEGQTLLPNVIWAVEVREAVQGADAVVLLTEWKEFAALDWNALKEIMRGNTFIDLRNVYVPKEMTQTGLNYYSIGRPKSS